MGLVCRSSELVLASHCARSMGVYTENVSSQMLLLLLLLLGRRRRLLLLLLLMLLMVLNFTFAFSFPFSLLNYIYFSLTLKRFTLEFLLFLSHVLLNGQTGLIIMSRWYSLVNT